MKDVPGTPEGRARLAASGIEAVSMTTDEFATFVRNEVNKWAKLVETSGATAISKIFEAGLGQLGINGDNTGVRVERFNTP